MKSEIIINGKKYDAVTGRLISSGKGLSAQAVDSVKIHGGVQKSQTLNRKFVKQPQATDVRTQAISQFKRRHDYEESILKAHKSRDVLPKRADAPEISRFGGSTRKTIQPISRQNRNIDSDIAPAQVHPLQERANAKIIEKRAEKQLPSANELKISAINEALEKAREEQKAHKKSRGIRKISFWRNRRFAGLASGFTVAVLGVGYLTYLNLPDISTRIAAIQSGMDIQAPAYVAQGYKLNGLAYFDGKNVNFDYKKDSAKYSIQQSEKSWDSMALKGNYVEPKWSADYSTTYSNGLTIYTSRNGEAVWVNDGKLFHLKSSDKLSIDEIRKIAASF